MANVVILYAYHRKKKDIERPCEFSDSSAHVLVDIPPDPSQRKKTIQASIMEYETQNTCTVSEAGTNTTRKVSATHGQLHLEGCWPKDVDMHDIEHRLRYRRKAEKDDAYVPAVKSMASSSEVYLRQNNAIDIFQYYFDGVETVKEKTSALSDDGFQIMTVLGDPLLGDSKTGRIPTTLSTRTVCALAWQPVEGPNGRRLAVAYSDLRHPPSSAAAGQPSESVMSYIWDPVNSNSPELSLVPPSQMWCVEFNPKDLHVVGGGCRNGAACLFDCRRGGKPILSTPLFGSGKCGAAESVGSGGIRALKWLQNSGRGQEMVTINGSNIVRVWDSRNLRDPVEVITLSSDRTHDAISLDYEPTTGPNRFVIGTSKGSVLACSRRGKKTDDRITREHYGHHGSVYSVQCSPHLPKVSLSAGDWTARVWHEDHENPLIVTKYGDSALVDAAWHPHHPGVFLTARMNGRLEVRNLIHKLCDVLVTYQVSNENLHCMKLHPEGKRVALGTANGKVYLGHLSKSLLDVAPYSIAGSSDFAAEKAEVEAILHRESGRERSLKKTTSVKTSTAPHYSPVQGKPPPTNSELVELTATYIAELEHYAVQEQVRHKIAKVRDNFLSAGKQAEAALRKAQAQPREDPVGKIDPVLAGFSTLIEMHELNATDSDSSDQNSQN
eukprot:TRINITY_DN38237_c0_g1_i1.p1 TRINITY_DN38237_c0_g1~~TRINITY_DN38237_c0_g1_i1.p1  ORF type:complete len:686 (+),score=174.55 TRINITY_DN38237_c0_g1_i1:61-2058(+)